MAALKHVVPKVTQLPGLLAVERETVIRLEISVS